MLAAILCNLGEAPQAPGTGRRRWADEIRPPLTRADLAVRAMGRTAKTELRLVAVPRMALAVSGMPAQVQLQIEEFEDVGPAFLAALDFDE
jgi:hypothetical protein